MEGVRSTMALFREEAGHLLKLEFAAALRLLAVLKKGRKIISVDIVASLAEN